MASALASRFRASPRPAGDAGPTEHQSLRLALILVAAFMVVLDCTI
jgi:hypothetical protein